MQKSISYLHRNVGVLREDGTFVTHRNESHIFRKYDGLGMSVGVLKELYESGCKRIIIILHRESGEQVFITKPEAFLQGVLYMDDQDSQRILPFKVLAQSSLGGFS